MSQPYPASVYPAKLLRIHISEADRFEDQPLYEAIVAKCRELRIAGATVFRGLEGYGETAELHRAHFIHSDQPIVISIVDTPAKIDTLIPIVEAMMNTGVIAVSEVQAMRVQKDS
jgi:PII-like signaling protein